MCLQLTLELTSDCLISMLPPGPNLPSLLQTLYIISNPTGFLDNCAQQYGDIFTLRVLGRHSPPVIFCSHPQTVQEIFTSLSDRFELGKVTHVFRPLTGDQSLIMQDGIRHQRQRQLLMPALHGEGLHRCGALICEITRTAWPIDRSVNVLDQMLEISLEIILRVVFGIQPGPRSQQLKAFLHQLLTRINSPLYSVQFFLPPLQQDLGSWSPWGQFLRLRQQIDRLLYAEIAERRNQQSLGQTGSDILSLLLAARDIAGEPLSDIELRDQLMTLLLLGHETTASGLTWVFYWLAQKPEILARLQQELEAIGPTDPMTLAQLPYLNAVCKEALRIYPIALITQPRRVQHSIQLEGYEFDPGTIVIPCIYLAHHRPDVYPEPTEFRPDRFLNQKFSPYEYLPFGGGNRSCIGMALALYEMKLILATLLQGYDFRPAYPLPSVQPTRRGITFVPPEPFHLQAQKKRSIAALTKLY